MRNEYLFIYVQIICHFECVIHVFRQSWFHLIPNFYFLLILLSLSLDSFSHLQFESFLQIEEKGRILRLTTKTIFIIYCVSLHLLKFYYESNFSYHIFSLTEGSYAFNCLHILKPKRNDVN